MNPIVAITGPTCTSKTSLAVSVAKQTGGVLLPLDQLHRYQYLTEGTGLDPHLLNQVSHFGFQILNPWEVSGPAHYLQWLSESIQLFRESRPIIIEGGCTSYLQTLIGHQRDPSFDGIRVVALREKATEGENLEIIGHRISHQKIEMIIRETKTLMEHQFISKGALPLLMCCEKQWQHTYEQNEVLAWAVRISARVYCPAYLALKEEISTTEARNRIISNVRAIQSYQSRRIQTIVSQQDHFDDNQIPALTADLVRFLSQKQPEK